jgi:hypothetical protein
LKALLTMDSWKLTRRIGLSASLSIDLNKLLETSDKLINLVAVNTYWSLVLDTSEEAGNPNFWIPKKDFSALEGPS